MNEQARTNQELIEEISILKQRNLELQQSEAERKRAEEELRESEGKYRNILENIEDGYFEVDLAGNFTFFNSSHCRIFGYPREEIQGVNYRAFIDAESAKKVFRVFNEVYVTGIPTKGFQWETIRKDGARTYIEVSVSLIARPGEKPTGFRGIVRDISERKRMEEEIREMSFRDQMTELYNRRGFITMAGQQIRTANRTQRPMLLTFIDCDGLKWINDTFGHEEGDRALIDTAHVLRQTFREADIVARLGGDEFAVLSIDAADGNPEELLKRLAQNIHAFNATGARPYSLSMSWGTVVYDPHSPLSLDELMSAADELMYAQKKEKSARKM
jgi:diguanylate cyclase (GGDEF)-like protein/PAS domain S-box-containing protein